jgi:hypothetical protein
VLLAEPVAAATAIPCAPAGAQIQCTTSNFGQAFQFRAPRRVTSALFSLKGGEGGAGSTDDNSAGRAGGAGGFTETTLTLHPGDVLVIYVGGPGADAQRCTGSGAGNDGRAGGTSGGVVTGGQGCDGWNLTPLCGGGGGGGGTFVLPQGAQPGDATTPVAVAAGGGGGSSVPGPGQPDVQAFSETAVGGFATITFTEPPARPRQGPDHHGGPNSNNDPGFDPSNDPDRRPPGVHPDAHSDETICRPEIGRCTIHPPAGLDSVFAVTARGGHRSVVLFGTLMGGQRPDCPGYHEVQSDWLQFGFSDRFAGSSWRKSATLTTRHKLTRAAALALSRRMQICFEAPYAFATRAGCSMGGHEQLRDGVLPDCAGAAAPCVLSRQALTHMGGWVVHLVFRVPASRQDPKALG